MCNASPTVASGHAAPIANTKPALMKTTTGAALEAYHKELAEAQKQVGVSGSQWESFGVCRCDREIRSNHDMQTFVYRNAKALFRKNGKKAAKLRLRWQSSWCRITSRTFHLRQCSKKIHQFGHLTLETCNTYLAQQK